VPLLLVVLISVYWRKIISLPKKYPLLAVFLLIIYLDFILDGENYLAWFSSSAFI